MIAGFHYLQGKVVFHFDSLACFLADGDQEASFVRISRNSQKVDNMKAGAASVKTKILYGLLVIVPIAVIFVVLAELIEVLELVAKTIGFHSTFNAGLAIILAMVFLIALCYLAGTLVHTKIGALSFEKFEQKLLLQIPGYGIISNILKGVAEEQIKAYRPALVQLGLPGASVLGFVMEENDDETVTVFVPSVPAITVGMLHIVERKRVTLLEASHVEVVNCLAAWGVGSKKFIGIKKTN